MAPQESPSRRLDQYLLRLPDGMREQLAEDAKANNRSMNAEIVARLEGSHTPAREVVALMKEITDRQAERAVQLDDYLERLTATEAEHRKTLDLQIQTMERLQVELTLKGETIKRLERELQDLKAFAAREVVPGLTELDSKVAEIYSVERSPMSALFSDLMDQALKDPAIVKMVEQKWIRGRAKRLGKGRADIASKAEKEGVARPRSNSSADQAHVDKPMPSRGSK